MLSILYYAGIINTSLLLSPPLLRCARLADAAGEITKDEKYLETVEKVGPDFNPLVVGKFWSLDPFCLKESTDNC